MRFDLKKIFGATERTADGYLFSTWDVLNDRVRAVTNAEGATEWRRWKRPKPKYRRIICGARCRDGHACKRRVVEGKRRCPNHGGLSTGPKTAEGRARIVASNQRRRAKT